MKYLIHMLMLCSFAVCAQGTDIKYVELNWNPNPAEENVGWYEVEFSNGGTWVSLARTEQTLFTAELSVISGEAPRPGLTYCFRIIAHRAGDNPASSAPSEMACATIPEPVITTPNVVPVTTLVLTTPGAPTVQLQR